MPEPLPLWIVQFIKTIMPIPAAYMYHVMLGDLFILKWNSEGQKTGSLGNMACANIDGDGVWGWSWTQMLCELQYWSVGVCWKVLSASHSLCFWLPCKQQWLPDEMAWLRWKFHFQVPWRSLGWLVKDCRNFRAGKNFRDQEAGTLIWPVIQITGRSN